MTVPTCPSTRLTGLRVRLDNANAGVGAIDLFRSSLATREIGPEKSWENENEPVIQTN